MAQGRRIEARVQIDYTDPFIDQSIDVEVNEQANVSYPGQTADGIQELKYKYASLDGSWALDGTYTLAPHNTEIPAQMGWWGEQLSGSGGVFTAPYPKLIVNFLSRPVLKLQVNGDNKRREYPVNFTIKLYNNNDTLLYTETITGNTSVKWEKELNETVTQVTKMELEITKWSHAGRQVKIVEFYTMIQEIYEGDALLTLNLLEESSAANNSLPIGTVSSNQIDLKLNNKTGIFNAGNTKSPLHNQLKPNRRIQAWMTGDEPLTWERYESQTWNELGDIPLPSIHCKFSYINKTRPLCFFG